MKISTNGINYKDLTRLDIILLAIQHANILNSEKATIWLKDVAQFDNDNSLNQPMSEYSNIEGKKFSFDKDNFFEQAAALMEISFKYDRAPGGKKFWKPIAEALKKSLSPSNYLLTLLFSEATYLLWPAPGFPGITYNARISKNWTNPDQNLNINLLRQQHKTFSIILERVKKDPDQKLDAIQLQNELSELENLIHELEIHNKLSKLI